MDEQDAARAGYPLILNGDHAEFERKWAGRDPRERPDWPLPSFDAKDWAEAFCRRFIISSIETLAPDSDQVGLMIGWFANALMRGFDEHASRVALSAPAEGSGLTEEAARLKKLDAAASPGKWETDHVGNDGDYGRGEDTYSGFRSWQIVGATGLVLFDTLNSDAAVVEVEHDEDETVAWDGVGRANAEFVAALVNAYRSGTLTDRARAEEAAYERGRREAEAVAEQLAHEAKLAAAAPVPEGGPTEEEVARWLQHATSSALDWSDWLPEASAVRALYAPFLAEIARLRDQPRPGGMPQAARYAEGAASRKSMAGTGLCWSYHAPPPLGPPAPTSLRRRLPASRMRSTILTGRRSGRAWSPGRWRMRPTRASSVLRGAPCLLTTRQHSPLSSAPSLPLVPRPWRCRRICGS